jgi:excisionase family DNA binding protein
MSDQEPDRIDQQPNLKDLITLGEAARLSGFTDRHLRKLASENQLWAVKLGRNWFTTAQAVNEYLAKNRKPGPKK